jgi:sigma-B regulation protein RsbU (phosphoserine phosphatase)
MMLLYSDGITDATSWKNERFGLDGIRRTINRMPALSAEMVCHALINSVTAHQGDCLQHDDMTVIVLRAVWVGWREKISADIHG